MKFQNVWCVDGAGHFQVYSTINWILCCKATGKNNNVGPMNYKEQSTETQWNNQLKNSLKMDFLSVCHVGGLGPFKVYTIITWIPCYCTIT